MPEAGRILTINTGSSSIKAAVFATTPAIERVASAAVAAVASPSARIVLRRQHGPVSFTDSPDIDHRGALDQIVSALRADSDPLLAISHRVVHGGLRLIDPEVLTPDGLNELRGLVPLAPNHQPVALDAIERLQTAYPHVPQIACFDTAFHRTMPSVARTYPLPIRPWTAGVRRFGFHGLSCESVMATLRASFPDRAGGRLVIAHLGNGSSMTAVRAGRSVETTMGFSPAGGLMMGTRTGDLDPGVLCYALEAGADTAEIQRVIWHESGLRGVSGNTHDMQVLLAIEGRDAKAAEAIALFCHIAKKGLGSLMAVLGGLDVLVFTGGIGEHAASIRERISTGLDDLGVRLDPARNRVPADPSGADTSSRVRVISDERSRTLVLVVATDEDWVLASHARDLMAKRA